MTDATFSERFEPSLADSVRDAFRKAEAAKKEAELPEKVQKAEKEALEARLATETKELGELKKISAEDTAAAQKALAREGASIEEMRSLKGQMPSPAQFATPLWQQFGSPGFIISQIASAFTRYPMVSALQSGGAALKALNEKDMAQYEQAFEAWKVNADLTIKRMNMEHEAYRDIAIQHHEKLEDWEAAMRATAAKFGDEQMLALINAGAHTKADELLAERQKQRGELEAGRDVLERREIARQILASDPNWTRGNAEQKAKALRDAESAAGIYQEAKAPVGSAEWFRWYEALKPDQQKQIQEILRVLHPNALPLLPPAGETPPETKQQGGFLNWLFPGSETAPAAPGPSA